MVALLLATLLGCGESLRVPEAPEANRRMAARLAELAEEAEEHRNPLATERLVAFYQQIEEAPDLRSRVRFAGLLGQAQLLDGQVEAAVTTLEGARESMLGTPKLFDARFRRSLESVLAVAYLRLGELENCVEGHNADACLLPIRSGGIHQKTRGARAALEIYEQILERHPDDLESRWLANIAAMALGEHPEAVPEPWRIDAEVYEGELDLPRLRDVGAASGVADGRLSGGVVMDDLDGDGLLDLLVSSWSSKDALRFYRNRGDGGFDDLTEAAGVGGLTGGLNLISGDVDNDGRLDVLVLRGAWRGRYGKLPDSLLLNRGPRGGAPVIFEDVTEAAGLLALHPTQTAAFTDLDLDGRLDLVVGREDGPPALFWNRSGTGEAAPGVVFEQAADPWPEGVFGRGKGSFVKAVVASDVDLDGDPDLFFSRFAAPNVLLRNDRPEFTDVTLKAGLGEPVASFPALFLDFDNDGRRDLLVAGFATDFLAARAPAVAADLLGESSAGEPSRLFRNVSENGELRFEDVSAQVGLNRVSLAMAAAAGDPDGDGFPDLYLGTGAPDFRALVPNRFFANRPDGEGRRFFDAGASSGLAHLQKGHGIAFGDLDGDGDEDLYEVLGGAYRGDGYPNALFENPRLSPGGEGAGSFNTLRLEGVRANRAALGARLHLVISGPGPSERSVHREIDTGGSFGAGSLQVELGLGPGEILDRVEVSWPGGEVETFRDLSPGKVYRLREGEGLPREELVRAFRLGKAGGAEGHSHAP